MFEVWPADTDIVCIGVILIAPGDQDGLSCHLLINGIPLFGVLIFLLQGEKSPGKGVRPAPGLHIEGPLIVVKEKLLDEVRPLGVKAIVALKLHVANLGDGGQVLRRRISAVMLYQVLIGLGILILIEVIEPVQLHGTPLGEFSALLEAVDHLFHLMLAIPGPVMGGSRNHDAGDVNVIGIQ